MASILQAMNVSRAFQTPSGAVNALVNINLDIEQGKLVCLKGRSGSGKTTLINILGTLDRQTSGDVLWQGESTTTLSDRARDKLRRQKMAFVFQSVALISTMTAFENVEFALRLAGYPANKRAARARECLTLVGLAKRIKHRPSELSGGEQQRVAIARAVSYNPEIIFADEPTAELDTPTGLAVMKLFSDLLEENPKLTIVMTTHDEAMMELSDIVYALSDGVIMDTIVNEKKGEC